MAKSRNPHQDPDTGGWITFMVHSGAAEPWDPTALHTTYYAENVTGGPWGCPVRFCTTVVTPDPATGSGETFARDQAKLWAALPLIPTTACHTCRLWRDGPKVPRMNAYQGQTAKLIPRTVYGGLYP